MLPNGGCEIFGSHISDIKVIITCVKPIMNERTSIPCLCREGAEGVVLISSWLYYLRLLLTMLDEHMYFIPITDATATQRHGGCGGGLLTCVTERICISPRLHCDGLANCGSLDGSDEHHCRGRAQATTDLLESCESRVVLGSCCLVHYTAYFLYPSVI